MFYIGFIITQCFSSGCCSAPNIIPPASAPSICNMYWIHMHTKIMGVFHSVTLKKMGKNKKEKMKKKRKKKKGASWILYSSINLLGIKHRAGRHIWWNASHQISIKGIETLRRLADNSPSNVLLFRLLKKLESQISCEMSDTNMPAQILKVKIKDTVSKLALQTKQLQKAPREHGANFIRSPWLFSQNSLSLKKNNNKRNAFLCSCQRPVSKTNSLSF